MSEDTKTAVFPHSELLTRFDGSKWRKFDIDNGFVIVTDSGRKLIKENPDILTYLAEYKQGKPERRKYLNEGQRAKIYEIPGTRVVVKEANYVHSVPDALNRMDYLFNLTSHLPNWVKVPEHLGLVYSTNLDKQYLIIEEVGNGDSVKDIQESKDATPKMKNLVTRQFERAKRILDNRIKQEIEAKKIPPKMQLLFDWHEGNVVVDFNTPTRELPFTMWVLDQ